MPPNGLRSGGGAGVDSVRDEEKLEARKMLDCPKGVPHAAEGGSPERPARALLGSL
ncbi:MAG: hypothetical protein HND47_13080 [Chloroflexi bacterium]|nr:hypothetical protein [Chloroflexota bacterium]